MDKYRCTVCGYIYDPEKGGLTGGIKPCTSFESLPAASRIKRKIDTACDLAITVDCNGVDMLGSSLGVVQNSKKILEIDHHAYRKPFGDIFIVDTKAAAVGELIYLLLEELKIDITDDIAQNILTSII